MNWGVAVVLCLSAALVPAVAESSFGQSGWLSALGRVDPAVLAGVAALPMMEFVWRDGLRPRLTWNGFGVMAVYPFRTRTIGWAEIERVVEGEHGFVKHVRIDTGNDRVVWEFDHFWLAAALSKRYAARAGRNGARLAEALAGWRNDADSAHASPPGIPRRPVLLYCLPFVSAGIAAVLFPG